MNGPQSSLIRAIFSSSAPRLDESIISVKDSKENSKVLLDADLKVAWSSGKTIIIQSMPSDSSPNFRGKGSIPSMSHTKPPQAHTPRSGIQYLPLPPEILLQSWPSCVGACLCCCCRSFLLLLLRWLAIFFETQVHNHLVESGRERVVAISDVVKAV
jgi:hypothetical protein